MQIPEFYHIVFWTIAAFWISKSIIPILLLISEKKHLFDDGDDYRKLHKGLIPTLGGVAIFTAFLISFSASSFANEIQGYGYFIAASVILFGAGLKDDLIIISPNKKFTAQFLATALIVFGCDMYFTSLGGVFGIESLSVWTGIPLTFFTVIVVINAFNLIDGIDGLAGSMGVLSAGFFGCWFYLAGLYSYSIFSFILVGAILGFLWFNRPPAKIFMGDTGSLIIGFFMSVLAINFVEYSRILPEVVFWQSASPIIVAAVMVVPLYDTLRIFIIRALNGKSPFEADQEHVHHHLIKSGFSHGQLVVLLLIINIFILGSVIILSNYLSNTWLLVFLLTECVLIFPTNHFKRKMLKPFVSDKWGKQMDNDNSYIEFIELESNGIHFLSEFDEEKDQKNKEETLQEA